MQKHKSRISLRNLMTQSQRPLWDRLDQQVTISYIDLSSKTKTKFGLHIRAAWS